MAESEEDFECWLSGKLRALNTDEGVFGTYIKGILEGEETLDDKTEALEGILSEITEDDIPKHCREILERWQNLSQVLNSKVKSEPEEDVEVKLVRLLESQSLPTVAPKSYTEEERKIREAILAQYSQMSDNEEDEVPEKGADSGMALGGSVSGAIGGSGTGVGAGGGSLLTRNTNAEEVQKAEREKRERARLESQRKKDKDKEDREKQKQLQQEKKEKRKTQKGERRRM